MGAGIGATESAAGATDGVLAVKAEAGKLQHEHMLGGLGVFAAGVSALGERVLEARSAAGGHGVLAAAAGVKGQGVLEAGGQDYLCIIV